MLLLSQSLPVLHPFFEAFIFRHLLLEIQTAVLFLEKNLGYYIRSLKLLYSAICC